jgi:hypothetical protein
MRLREEGKEWFDTKASLRTDLMIPGDLVLIKDVVRDLDMSCARKLEPWWKGPFRVKLTSATGTYILEELDGTQLRSTYAGNWLKKFYQRLVLDVENILVQEPSLSMKELGLMTDWMDAPALTQELRRSKRLRELSPMQPMPRTDARGPEVRIPARTIDRSEYEWFDEEQDDLRTFD